MQVENALIYTSVYLYQLGLFNPRFWGYFYKDSVNLCPDIKKISPVSGFCRSAGSEIFTTNINKFNEGTHE